MKKVFFILSLLMISCSSFAVVNFSSSTGNLVLRNVSIDDSLILYDSVTLNVNLATGTFVIIEAIEKHISPFSESPIDTYTASDFKVDLHGCVQTRWDEVTCMTRVVSLVGDKDVTMGSILNSIFDNFSRQYQAETINVLSKPVMGVFGFHVIRGIPVDVKFTFKDIDPEATSISLFSPQFSAFTSSSGGVVVPKFRNIPIIK